MAPDAIGVVGCRCRCASSCLLPWLSLCVFRVCVKGIALFSLLKVIYVSKKMKMQPFTAKTMLLLLIISIMFMIFYFIDLPFNAYLNILIKSSLITVVFLFLVIKLKLSLDINLMIDRYFK